MGNTQPQNKTGKKVVQQKLENAQKTGILSLSEHHLEHCPMQIFEITKLTTLDLSKNKLNGIDPKIVNLKLLKLLNVDDNQLGPGSLAAISQLTKLKSLSANKNRLGRPHPEAPKAPPLPDNLPKGLKTLLLSNNYLSNIPRPIVSKSMSLLEKLDLSHNHLASVPEEIANLTSLSDLNLDANAIVSLPEAMGRLSRLKTLSLKQNHISVHSNTVWNDDTNPQPLPASLFQDTPLIDLNLHGNPMTSTQLNTMKGYDDFLERRREVKFTGIVTGAMIDLDTCGLE
ncbi:Miro domain containing protein [Nitzschia inconspicua]|uniref:Miro domain containing protein n=1 Tax=Nitzschia inconspicua TaxID=303405 RepID=A0A9K3PE63_9STRA|nr:Miro domain containing protein [Nitzschia inconspicua]